MKNEYLSFRKTIAGIAAAFGVAALLTPNHVMAQENDLCANAIALECGDIASGSTAAAAVDGPATTCTESTFIGPDVWYTVVGTGLDITADLCGSSYDTRLDIYEGDCGSLVCVGSNDDFCGSQSQVTWTSTQDVTYYIRVHGWNGATGDYSLEIACEFAPCDNSTANGGDGQWPGNSITPDGNNVTNISTALYLGSEFSVLTGIVAGDYYRITHAGGAFITVREGAVAGPVIASGSSAVEFTAQSASDLYVHYNGDENCTLLGAGNGVWTATVQNLGNPPCDNSVANGGDGQFPFAVITPNAEGLVTTIATNLYAGSEFSQIGGIIAGHEYEFTHANGAFITVRVGAADGPLLGSGLSPLTVIANGTQNLFVHWNADQNCGIDATGSFLATVQDLGLPPCNNSSVGGQWPTAIITPDAEGAVTPISTSLYLGSEYSVLSGITQDAEYELVNSAGAYITVREGAVDGPVVASGFSPLTFTATSSANLFVHWTVDEFCATNGTGTASATVQLLIPCEATAGTLVADASPVTLVEGSATISATEGTAPFVPAGYSVLYVLTEGAGLVIIDAAATPSFTVTAAGDYTIHTLVYDPLTLDVTTVEFGVTTGVDVNGLLIQGGGEICGALDVAGAAFVVEEEETCDAAAGTLTADASPVTLVEGSATISATEGTAPFVPAGYSVLYVLTEGAGLVIVDAAATPSFTVTTAGDYTIHTLVYDPLTLDVTTVEFGMTTGFDVNGLLIQGGGEICGALDVAGAAIVVEEEETCDATAGTLTADVTPVTLVEGSATISATEGTAPFVPAGYSVLYVLTEGAGLVIVDAAATPSFTVDAAGDYTIHTLVYDPLTLDVSTVEFGVTTGFDVNGLLIQGGGEICGALDVAGAAIVVEEEVVVTCDATAGTLTADASPVTLVGGSATISATEGTAPFVPEGYSVLYVLTEGAGLVIIDAAATPSFTVDAIGDYTIHTLVYDPLTLDVTTVEFGVTTGVDVNGLLIQGGGDICGALDVAGAPIVVDEVVGLIEGMNGSLSVYPNPSNGQFIVELNGAEGVGTLNVMDMTGRMVYTEGVNFSGDFRHALDLNVVSGSYILQVLTAQGVVTTRLQFN
jgi:hypothetical protein